MRKMGWILVAVVLAMTSNASAQVDTAWVRWFWSEGEFYDAVNAIAVDGAGNLVIVGGSSVGPSAEAFAAKCDVNGEIVWQRKYASEAGFGDSFTRVAVDSFDNIYAAGTEVAYGSTGVLSQDANLLKLTNTGDIVWKKVIDGPAHRYEGVSVLRVLPDNNVCAVIGSQNAADDTDFEVRIYDPDGTLLWADRYQGDGGKNDYISGLEVDHAGNLYLCGTSETANAVPRLLLCRYSNVGLRSWVQTWSAPGSELNSGRSLVYDSSGRLIVLGRSRFGQSSMWDFLLAEFDLGGTLSWYRTYDAGEHRNEYPEELVLLSGGRVVAVGSTSTNLSRENYIIVCYDENGVECWSTQFDDGFGLWDEAVDIVSVSTDILAITGRSTVADRNGFRRSAVTLLLNPNDGALEDTLLFTGFPKSDAEGGGLVMGSNGDLFLYGKGDSYSDPYRGFVLKYDFRITCMLDVLPGSCPNIINTGVTDLDYHGIRPGSASANRPTVPIAVLGTKAFDVSRIDPSTIAIAGLSPLSNRLMDVSRPMEIRESECECTSAGADGYTDLVFYFDQEQLLTALAPVVDGEVRTMALSGKTKTGVPLSGSDCLTIKDGPIRVSPLASAGEKSESGFAAYPNPFNSATVVSFTLATESDVRLEVYDVLGRRVATLVDDMMPAGEHQVSWDAAGWASGVYFARLTTSAGMMTRKMVLVR